MDRQAFEALYLELEQALFNIAYRWVWDEEEAMDVVQDTFCRVWERRPSLEPEQLKSYLYRTTINRASNLRRRNLLWQWTGLEALAPQLARGRPDEPVLRAESEYLVRKAIDSLPKRYKDVILLHRFSGLSQAEVGQILGIATGTVASRHHKALKLLKKKLEPLGFSP